MPSPTTTESDEVDRLLRQATTKLSDALTRIARMEPVDVMTMRALDRSMTKAFAAADACVVALDDLAER